MVGPRVKIIDFHGFSWYRPYQFFSLYILKQQYPRKFRWRWMGRLRKRGVRIMNFEAIKTAVMNFDAGEQRRVVLELLPEIWPQIVGDDACLILIRKLVDEESVRSYQQEHLDHI
jgi:hypothetical protein